jgi:hypothetical protein
MIPLMDGLMQMIECETDFPIRKPRIVQKRRPDPFSRRNVLTRKHVSLVRLINNEVQ